MFSTTCGKNEAQVSIIAFRRSKGAMWLTI